MLSLTSIGSITMESYILQVMEITWIVQLRVSARISELLFLLSSSTHRLLKFVLLYVTDGIESFDEAYS